jgi:hypothetical protein
VASAAHSLTQIIMDLSAPSRPVEANGSFVILGDIMTK